MEKYGINIVNTRNNYLILEEIMLSRLTKKELYFKLNNLK